MTRLWGVGGSLFSSDAVGNITDCGEERGRTRAALGSVGEPHSIPHESATPSHCPGTVILATYSSVWCTRGAVTGELSQKRYIGKFRQKGQEEQSAGEVASAVALKPGGTQGCGHRDPGVRLQRFGVSREKAEEWAERGLAWRSSG